MGLGGLAGEIVGAGTGVVDGGGCCAVDDVKGGGGLGVEAVDVGAAVA